MSEILQLPGGEQLTLTWGHDALEAARELYREKFRRVRATSVRRGLRVQSSADEGARVLAKRDYDPIKTPGYLVRVFYRSAGGEVLAFDCGPLTEKRALQVVTRYGQGEPGWPAFDEVTPPPASDALGAEVRLGNRPDLLADSLIKEPDQRKVLPECTYSAAARLVVLPSQG